MPPGWALLMNSIVCCGNEWRYFHFQFVDSSVSGTVVYRGQHGDSDSPGTTKSRLGQQERTSSEALEDSGINLAEVVIHF